MHREYILNVQNLRETMLAVWNLTVELVQQGEILLIVTEISKSRAQEKKYHTLIGEIAKQVKFQREGIVGQPAVEKTYDLDTWKALLIDEFERTKQEMGEPLSKPGRMVPSLSGGHMVSIRPTTTKFKKREASEFIEFLYAKGVEYGVKWSATAEQIAEAERLGG